MIATHTQQSPVDSFPRHTLPEPAHPTQTAITPAPQLLTQRAVMHHAKAGLNPLVDAACALITVLNELKLTKTYRQIEKLQHQLVQEINAFHEIVSHRGYGPEYLIVCRYILCATFDDILAHTLWGAQGRWDAHSLLKAFNQDTQHQDKFFSILERALKDPALYIDLMELIYICLSMGYKGQYRGTEYNQFQLEQVVNNLYKHIRAYRGSFSKSLSPAPLKSFKSAKKAAVQSDTSLLFIFFLTACMIMVIFISLDYLMDVISNEAYKNIAQISTPAVSPATK